MCTFSRSASRILGPGRGNCRLEHVKKRRLLPSCSHVATSGAADRSQSSHAPCTSSPEKGISVPCCSGRNFKRRAYSLFGAVGKNGVSICIYISFHIKL